MVRKGLIPVVLLVLAGCHGSSHPATVATTSTLAPATTTTVARGTAPSTTIAIQASGPRTVLSPIGLNIRSQPSKTAPVLGTAAQGAVVTVISHTVGWYMVKGATRSGYISDDPALSAEGKFTAYDSSQHNFTALYPDTWASTEVPPASVVFHPMTGTDSVAVSTATTVSQLTRGRAGYRQQGDSVVVVCGVTGDLVTYLQTTSSPPTSAGPATSAPPTAAGPATSTATPASAERYLVQVHLTLDASHALGIDANLADLAQLLIVQNFVHSVAFPFPQCQGGAASPQTSTTTPASTVP